MGFSPSSAIPGEGTLPGELRPLQSTGFDPTAAAETTGFHQIDPVSPQFTISGEARQPGKPLRPEFPAANEPLISAEPPSPAVPTVTGQIPQAEGTDQIDQIRKSLISSGIVTAEQLNAFEQNAAFPGWSNLSTAIDSILQIFGHGRGLAGLGNIALGGLFGLGELGNVQLESKEVGVLDTLIGLLNRYAALTPAEAVTGIHGFEEPMSQELFNVIMNQVQAGMSERGLAGSPGLMAEATAQALAPYQYGEQQLATSDYFNLRRLPLDVNIPAFQPANLSAIINFLTAGGFGAPKPGASGAPSPTGRTGPPGPTTTPTAPGVPPTPPTFPRGGATGAGPEPGAEPGDLAQQTGFYNPQTGFYDRMPQPGDLVGYDPVTGDFSGIVSADGTVVSPQDFFSPDDSDGGDAGLPPNPFDPNSPAFDPFGTGVFPQGDPTSPDSGAEGLGNIPDIPFDIPDEELETGS